jgi:hypothetical protein
MKISGKTQAEVDAENVESARLVEIAELETYLTSTDWYATRMAETGKAIPEEIIGKRKAARDRISALRG